MAHAARPPKRAPATRPNNRRFTRLLRLSRPAWLRYSRRTRGHSDTMTRASKNVAPAPATRRTALHQLRDLVSDRLPTLLLLAVVFVLVEAVVGYYAFVRYEALFLAERQTRLETIGALEGARLSQWLASHVARAEALAADADFAGHVEQLLTPSGKANADVVVQRLRGIEDVHRYAGAKVVTGTGRVVAPSNAKPVRFVDEDFRVTQLALEHQRAAVSAVHYDADRVPLLAVAVPLRGAGNRRTDAVVLLEIPTGGLLASDVLDRAHDRTAIKLVRVADGVLTYLDGIHDPPPPLTSGGAADSLAAQLLSGKRGILEGTDYRGVAVLAAVAEVPGTDWLVVAKADADELRSSVERGARLVAAVFLSLILFIAIAAYQALRARETSIRLRAREERAQLAAIVEGADDAIVGCDLERRILSWNHGAERLFGYAATEVIGRPVMFLLPPGEPPDDDALRRVSAGEIVRTASVLRQRKDGTLIPVSINRSPMRDESGRVVGVARIFRDISEQQRAAATSTRLAAIVESSDDAMLTRDLDGTITSWNRGAERLFGYTAEEAIGRDASMLYPPDEPEDLAARNARLQENHRLPPFRSERMHKDGRRIDVLATISALRDPGGAFVGASIVLQDMSELLAVERKLSETEERLRAAFDQAAVGIALRAADPEKSRWLRVNQRFCEMVGYSEAELLSMTSLDMTPPEDREESIGHSRRVVTGQVSGYSRPKRYVRKDGSILWVNLSLSLIRDKEGMPLHVLSVIEDITDRMHTQRKLQRLTAFHAALVDTNEAIARAQDLKALCERVCEIAAEKTGLLVAWIGLVDETAACVVPIAAAGPAVAYARGIDITLDTGSPTGQGPTARALRENRACIVDDFAADPLMAAWQRRAADYGIRSSAAFPLHRGGVPCGCLNLYAGETGYFDDELVKLLQEMTLDLSFALDMLDREAERRAAEQRLRESEARYRLLVRHFPDGLVMLFDTGLRCLIADGTALASTGLDRAALVGRVLPEGLPGIGVMMKAYCARALAGRTVQATLGAFQRDWMLQVLPVHGGSGESVGCMVILNDVTDKLQAEEQLRRLNLELEARIEERTRELANANQDLAAANAELDAFAYSVSHDLRGTLRRLQGFAALLLESNHERLDATSAHQLDRVRANAEHMGQLVDDLLRLSRVSRHKLARVTFDLAPLARSHVGLLTEQHPDRAVEVVIADPLTAYGDPMLVRLALGNLLDNAWKYTRHADRARIEIGVEMLDTERVFYVKDNGAGFDPRYAARLFRAFERLHSEKEFEGTGIGLTIVHRVITKHGGRVWAAGEPGVGACFRFTLPEAGEPPAPYVVALPPAPV